MGNSKQNPLIAWFDVRRKSFTSWAFAINRLTGIGLTVYLYLHLIVLNTLRQGESGWNDFLEIAKSTPFLLLDVILLFGVLYHSLNGIRVGMVGSGIGVKRQSVLLWSLLGICLILFVVGSVLILTK